jgi:peroxidase
MDARIVEDLRNLLVDPPVAQDLAAINIQRGRDLGLPTLNEARAALGLPLHGRFEEITGDAGTAAGLAAAFGSPDQVDLWTGGLAEQPRGEAFLGETFARILADQFTRLRDGDPFWYQADGLEPSLLAEIKATRLSDIILRNTDTRWLQADLFLFAERRAPGAVPEDPEAPQLVVGSDADEVLVGGAADDTLIGAGGDDLALYPTALGEAQVTRQDDAGWLVVGPVGKDRLVEVERLRFADAEVRLDPADWAL